MKLLCLLLIALAACEHGKGGAMVSRDGGGSGTECGGLAAKPCAADEWCDFGRNDCGGSDATGVCKARPFGCPDLADPVCGCDGTVHGNECDAQAAGFDVSDVGGCPVPAGFFACGARRCSLELEYCQRSTSDIGGEPDGFTCLPLPALCGAQPSCGCLGAEPCGSICDGDATTGLTAICPGG